MRLTFRPNSHAKEHKMRIEHGQNNDHTIILKEIKIRNHKKWKKEET